MSSVVDALYPRGETRIITIHPPTNFVVGAGAPWVFCTNTAGGG